MVAGLTLVIAVACVVGTACLVKRQVYVAICDAFPIAIDGPAGAAVDLGAGLPGSHSPGAHLPGADLPDEPSGHAYLASQTRPVDIDPETTPARVRFYAAPRAIEVGLADGTPLDREIWCGERTKT